MSVHSWRELPRVNRHLIGESPEMERRFVVTLNDPDTPSTEMIEAVGTPHGAEHPELPFLVCNSVEVNEAYEGNRYWAEVVALYRVPDIEDPTLLPWLRPDVWKFEGSGVMVPALYYYDDNGDQKPLTNSAGDAFEGLTVEESQQKITVTGNREVFPSALAAAITNTVNDDNYLGFARDCVKVAGISAEGATEVIAGEEVRYWKVTATLVARQTGWNLLLPDVGFNHIEGGQRKRATVTGPEGDQIASANPVPLNGSGGIKAAGQLPNILTRRVYKRITMDQFFGTPPA